MSANNDKLRELLDWLLDREAARWSTGPATGAEVEVIIREVRRLLAEDAALAPQAEPRAESQDAEFIDKVNKAINAMCDPTSPNFARNAVEVRAGMDVIRDRTVEFVRNAAKRAPARVPQEVKKLVEMAMAAQLLTTCRDRSDHDEMMRVRAVYTGWLDSLAATEPSATDARLIAAVDVVRRRVACGDLVLSSPTESMMRTCLADLDDVFAAARAAAGSKEGGHGP